LPWHRHNAAFGVDVVEVQVTQLAPAHPRRVGHLHDRPVPESHRITQVRGGKHRLDLSQVEDRFRQAALDAGHLQLGRRVEGDARSTC
jgi:hypothetical protein